MEWERYLDELFPDVEKAKQKYDMDIVKKALEVAFEAHKGQFRRSGEPYIIHPVAVAKIIIDMGMDIDCVCAALLHDVVEDTEMTDEQIKKMFGKDVAAIVNGVTKISKMELSSREEQQAENLRKMLLAMADDVRVVIIKLADRLHNMRTMKFMKEQKRRDKSLETIEFYAPLAHRLGIRAVKEELEDLAIGFLDPIGYEEIKNSLEKQNAKRKDFIASIKACIKKRVSEVVANPKVDGRIKSIRGIYKKMYEGGKELDEIYDVYAFRVIVDTVVDCYNVLGIIHDAFNPIPKRFKDYIGTPKPNMYQSLHTTVIGKDGIPFEVQIRTWEMHQTAEYGIAAHWKYKLGLTDKQDLQTRVQWLREMLETNNESDDVEELVRTIKTDLVPEEVLIYSPKGEVFSLPYKSTTIDFAYRIHSAVGDRMIGAKVGGRIVPIDYQLKTGDIVEILTTSQKGHGPSRDWIKIVRTNEARNKIKSWFKKEKREENIVEGKAEVEKEFRRNNIVLPEKEMEAFMQTIVTRHRVSTLEDFYAAVGYGGIIFSKSISRIRDDYQKIVKAKQEELGLEQQSSNEIQPIRSKSTDGIIVENIGDCLVKISRCCNPIPGDDIIGFITRGHGVSVHKRDCTNVPKDISKADEPERWVKTMWDQEVKEEFKSTLLIAAQDRKDLLRDVINLLSAMGVGGGIHTMNARPTTDGRCMIVVTVSVNGMEHLKNVVSKICKITGVLSVERGGL